MIESLKKILARAYSQLLMGWVENTAGDGNIPCVTGKPRKMRLPGDPKQRNTKRKSSGTSKFIMIGALGWPYAMVPPKNCRVQLVMSTFGYQIRFQKCNCQVQTYEFSQDQEACLTHTQGLMSLDTLSAVFSHSTVMVYPYKPTRFPMHSFLCSIKYG